jgi:peptidoglycan hydrolase-like protein with peptidoglycan-binding domain
MNGSTEVVHLRLPRLQRDSPDRPQTKRLQHLLNTTLLFEQLPETGGFGAGTERTVKEFQEGQGLVADGKVGEETWAALLTHWLSGDEPG